jgi:RsiW-degrading membrane proteinase PrsW (M82 family)
VKQLRSQLYYKSRSRSFLWKLCIGTVLVGVVVGFFSRFFEFKSELTLQSRIETYLASNSSEFTRVSNIQDQMAEVVLNVLKESFETGELETEELLIEIPYLRLWIQADQYSKFEVLIRSYLPAADSDMVLLFMRALGDSPDEAAIRLEGLATGDPAPRYANQILGLIATNAQFLNKAYPYFLKEGEFPDAQWAREQAVVNRHFKKDYVALDTLANNPLYSDAFNPWIRADIASHNRDWPSTLQWIALGQLASIEAGTFILATLGMLIWGTILMQLCQVTRFDKLTPLLCFLALLLGALSTVPTLLWVILEDMFLPISEGEDTLHTIVYYIATVGLREEVCKLLLFLPLAPILIKRGNEMEFLLVASFAGLGFAFEENFSYLSSSLGTASTSRFLTANFLHISLTGMSGLFFCRAWGTRGYSHNDFLFIFGIAILAHGLYDAFLIKPPMEDGGISATILFIVFSKYYFQEARKLQITSKTTISMSGTIVFGISLLTASLLVYLSIILNLSQAIELAVGSFLSSAIILFMFFREFNESLTE